MTAKKTTKGKGKTTTRNKNYSLLSPEAKQRSEAVGLIVNGITNAVAKLCDSVEPALKFHEDDASMKALVAGGLKGRVEVKIVWDDGERSWRWAELL